MLELGSFHWSRVVLILLLVALLMLAGCGSGNIVFVGTVIGSNGEPLSSRLVVVFLNNQEVGRDVSHDVVQSAGRHNGVFTITIPNAWNFADYEFGTEGQKEIATFDIYRQYSLLEGATKNIKLSDRDDFFAIKVFSGEESRLSVDVRSKRLALLPNQEVAVSGQASVVVQSPDYFSRSMLAFAGFLFTFTMAAYVLPSIIPKRTKAGTVKARRSERPSLEDLFIEGRPLRELVILGIATAFSLIFASWLLTDSAAENLIKQLTDQYYAITSLFIGILTLAMTIPLLRRKNVLSKRRKKLDGKDEPPSEDGTSPKRKE